MTISPVSRAPLSLEVAQRLRAAILDGTFPPDTELPTETELARSFGVGRSTVREAIRVLQAHGLLSGADTVSTARPRVTHERTADAAGLVLSTALQVGAIPLADLVALRVLLEAEAMRHVTAVPDAARSCLRAMAAAVESTDIRAFHTADVDFHVQLAYAGGNRALGFVIGVLRDCIAGYLLDALAALDDPGTVLVRLLAEHRAIVDALDAGDNDRAAALMVDHIRGFYEPEDASP
ncbi:FadR/GntR family transcriptional regulator [Thermomonospora amylolytica]|uniref:FadR/GntR family transcriptional regulator n=1 Tax=Thermomonospora amylolytica TaxID=1411117 RepID=UPI000E6C13CF|nr:FCD domain-containing protein [Thermomonospora amylolytica]